MGKEMDVSSPRDSSVDLDLIFSGFKKPERRLRNRPRDLKNADETLLRIGQELAAERSVARRLQQVSTKLIQADELKMLYEQILDAAIAVLHADFASIQLFNPERGPGGELQLLDHRGFNERSAKFWEWVRPVSRSVCGVALRTRQRVIVPDVEKCDFMAGTDDQKMYLETGIHAVQTTPLLSRSGNVLAMFSTHWREPHELTVSEQHTLDVLARQASDLIDRKLADQKLRESKERYRALIQASSEVLYRMNPDWSEMRQLQGGNFIADTEEPNPNWLQDYIHADDRKMVMEIVGKALQTGTVFELEHRVIRIDGTLGWTHSRAVPVRNSAGEIIEWFGSASDITIRKLAEDAVYRAKKDWEQTFDAVSDLIAVIDGNNRITRVNKAMAARLGMAPAECLGLTCYQVFHGSDEPPAFCPHKQLLEDGMEHSAELHIERLGGDFILDASPIYDSTGEIVGVVHVCHDITARKQTEEEIRNQKAILETINSIFYQTLTCESEEQFGRSCLTALEFITQSKIGFISEIGSDGCLHDIAMSDPDWDKCPTYDATGHRRRSGDFKIHGLCGRVLEDGKSLLTNDPYSHPDSIAIPVGYPVLKAFLGVPLKLEGKTIGIIGLGNREGGYTATHLEMVEAIAPAIIQALWRKRAEEASCRVHNELELRVEERTAELESANKELRRVPSKLIEAQEKERKRLASELHDSIGQTLAALKFRMEFILNVMRNGNQDEALKSTEEFIPILQRSIEETRAIYMGLRPKLLEDFGILAALKWCREELLTLYPERHIELSLNIEEYQVPKRLHIPIFRIAQEALNNASKHSRAEWVDVSLSHGGKIIELVVSDDGMGMNLNQVLQSSSARSLGLTGMRERAEITGGRFSINSAPGEGTVVRVYWPAEGKLNDIFKTD